MSDDEFDAPKGKRAAPKKIAKKDMYQVLMIIVDCGPHMMKADVGGSTSFDCAREAVDWILTRKIFTQAKDKVNIILLGAEQTQNELGIDHVAVKDELLAYVGFDHLRFIQEEVKMTTKEASAADGLEVAVDFLKAQTVGDMAVDQRHILLITNEEATLGDEKKMKSIETAVNDIGANVIVMGLDAASSTKTSDRIQKFVESVEGTSISFGEASKLLHNYTQKKIAPRAMKKNWEILPGVALPLAFHMRSTPAKNPLKAVTVNSKGEEVKREQQYYVKGKADDEFIDDDGENGAGGKAVEKEDLVYGYLFGKSKVVLTEDDVAEYGSHNYNEGDKGGCLKLLQFTPRSNIPPSFFIGTNSYSVVPAVDKKTAGRDSQLMKLTLSLVESMLEQDTVAICRYAYHASANLQLMALLPRKNEETGQLYMTAIRLPFMDDWRPFSLPDVSLRGPPPSAEKLNAIDELIDAMDLSKSDNSYEDVMNPFFQRQCTAMKAKALKQMGLDKEINLEPSVFLKRSLEPDPRLLESEEIKKLATSLPELFNLEEIIRIKRSRKDILAQNKDFLKGYDEEEEEEEEEAVKAEFEPIAMPDPDGPHKKFWDKVRKSLESGGNAINSWTGHVASDMSLFDEGSLSAVEKFKILRAEMLAKERTVDFNKWMMSLHGNDEYSDFFQFMDSRNEPSLITKSESADSWYTEVESEMYWSGMLDEEKKK